LDTLDRMEAARLDLLGPGDEASYDALATIGVTIRDVHDEAAAEARELDRAAARFRREH
jgi:hypothetical protein